MSVRVVSIEIVVDAASDLDAEAVVLSLLERERHDTDAHPISNWQVTDVAPHFSEKAKAYNP